MSREWIGVAPDSREEEASVKTVVSSDFKDVRVKSIDESAIGSTRVSYQVRGMWKDKFSFKETDFDTLRVPGAGRMQVEGAPETPQEGLFVAVPENAEVTGVNVIGKKDKELAGEYIILPASKPVLEGTEPEHIPDPKIYESDKPFPGKDMELIETKRIAGRTVAHILIHPVQYKPQSKKVTVLESIDLEVVYETRPGMDAEPRRRLMRRSPMDNMILDAESIAEGEKLRAAGGPSVETDALGLKSSDNRGEYLIITTQDLENSVGTLVSAKQGDHTVKVVTKAEIVSQFPQPSADQSIRAFLQYAVDHWYDPPEWVVLAGDTDKIPTHMTHYLTSPYTSDDLASDHYYADLSGDLTPEIVVSRLPVSNIQDMMRLCCIAACYGKKSGPWRNKILLTAYQNTQPWYINCKDQQVATTIGTHFSVLKRYAGVATKQQLIDALDAGAVIANYRGHGDVDRWSADWSVSGGGTEEFDDDDVESLNCDHRPAHVFSIACENSHIDMSGECFGETWVRNGKAATFLGASRPSFTSPNHDFDEYLFDAIINHGISRVGDIMNWAKTKLLLNYPGTMTQDNIRMYLLLGDPTAGAYFVGNSSTEELHVADCRWGTQIASWNRVLFSTIEQALQQGYNGCYYCLREYDTG